MELYDGSTALIAACYGGYTEIAELLIQHDEVKRRLKQISCTRTRSGSTGISSRNGSRDSADGVTVTASASSDQYGSNSLVGRSLSSRSVDVESLRAHVSIVNHRYKQGSTALMAATYRGFVDVARVLVDHKIDVNATNDEGWSALTVAAEKGCYNITKLLLEHGANPNQCNTTGFVPLMYACKLGFVDIARELIAHGAVVNHIVFDPPRSPTTADKSSPDSPSSDDAVAPDKFNGKGSTHSHGATLSMDLIDGYLPPLMLAIASHDLELVQLLIDSGADLNINMHTVSGGYLTKRDFSSILAYTNSRQQREMATEITESNSSTTDTNSTPASGPKSGMGFKKGGGKLTAKDIRALEEKENRQLEAVIDELEEMGAVYDYFSTPLMFAVFVERPEIVSLLLKSGANCEAVNEDNDTAIVLAALIGNVSIIKHLLNAGVHVSFRTDSGRTIRYIMTSLLRRYQFFATTHFVTRYLYRVIGGGGGGNSGKGSSSAGRGVKAKSE